MKVRIKELAQEAKFIRFEENKIRKTKSPDVTCGEILDFCKLRSHRTHEVREAARAAQLAYGFLRDIPYSKIESKRKREKEWLFNQRVKPEIKRLAKKFGNLYGKENYDDEIEKWLNT